MKVPPSEAIYPGHGEATIVGAERSGNKLLRILGGLDEVLGSGRECRVRGADAEFLVESGDYDGGTKVLVRWKNGSRDVIPGSWVEKLWKVTGRRLNC